jgi:hypothetical protein
MDRHLNEARNLLCRIDHFGVRRCHPVRDSPFGLKAVLPQILPANADQDIGNPNALMTISHRPKSKTPAGVTRQGLFVRWMLRGEV